MLIEESELTCNNRDKSWREDYRSTVSFRGRVISLSAKHSADLVTWGLPKYREDFCEIVYFTAEELSIEEKKTFISVF